MVGLAMTVVIAIVAPLIYLWRIGIPYQSKNYNPTRKYYVQKYQTLSVNTFTASMPGSGSDKIDGYLRLFTSEGKFLEERYRVFIRDVEPIWSVDGRKVYISGGSGEEEPWLLPSSVNDN